MGCKGLSITRTCLHDEGHKNYTYCSNVDADLTITYFKTMSKLVDYDFALVKGNTFFPDIQYLILRSTCSLI